MHAHTPDAKRKKTCPVFQTSRGTAMEHISSYDTIAVDVSTMLLYNETVLTHALRLHVYPRAAYRRPSWILGVVGAGAIWKGTTTEQI